MGLEGKGRIRFFSDRLGEGPDMGLFLIYAGAACRNKGIVAG